MPDSTPGSSPTEGFSLSSFPPVFVLPTHLSLESLHEIEETFAASGARLTYDVLEAKLIFGKVSQKKRAALELRSRGLWTEEVTQPPRSDEPPTKRRRIEPQEVPTDQAEEVYLSTETEAGDDSVRHSNRGSDTHVKRKDPLNSPDRLRFASSPRMTSESDTIKVVRLEWLDQCVSAHGVIPLDPFVVYHARQIDRPTSNSTATVDTKGIPDRAKEDTALNPATTPSGGSSSSRPQKLHYRETTPEEDHSVPIAPAPDWVQNNVLYACMRSSPLHPPNEDFVNQLVKIRTIRELNLDYVGVRAYSTAIAAIAAYPHPLHRRSQILALPGCDNKIANLFSEFKESDTRTIADAASLDNDIDLRTLNTFAQIWGVGAKTARDFYYAHHWHDLDGIVEHGWSSLSRVQQIGLKYYDEFNLPIPRAEAERIASTIQRHANLVRPSAAYDGRGIEYILVGSYRRGKEVSHDVDVILTHRDEAVTKNLIVDVVQSLEAEWITHTLSLHVTTSTRNQQTLPYRGEGRGNSKNHFDTLDKALVVWQDPDFDYDDDEKENSSGEPQAMQSEATAAVAERRRRRRKRNPNPHRRVDIIISPWRTVGCAVVGWTGDTTFERDLRRYAKSSRGWKFDSSGVRERTSGGQVVDLESRGETWEERERLVMEGLGVGWRPPQERCTR